MAIVGPALCYGGSVQFGTNTMMERGYDLPRSGGAPEYRSIPVRSSIKRQSRRLFDEALLQHDSRKRPSLVALVLFKTPQVKEKSKACPRERTPRVPANLLPVTRFYPVRSCRHHKLVLPSSGHQEPSNHVSSKEEDQLIRQDPVARTL